MTTAQEIKRKAFSYMLDPTLDPRITDLVNRAVYRSKSDLVETAIRELLARHDDATDKAAA